MRQASDAPRLFTNIVGNKISSHVYDPFGIELSAPGTNRLKFTGHERDLWDSVGGGDDLDYMHARFYLPLMGRFSSVDPIGGNPFAPQSWNRYSYVLGNPMKYIDPWGLTGEEFNQDDVIDIGLEEETLVTSSGFGDEITVTGVPWSWDLSWLVGGAFDSAAMLAGWTLGLLPPHGVAPASMTSQLAETPAMGNIREEFKRNRCEDGVYGSDYQYREVMTTVNPTGQLVGGFVATLTNVSQGHVMLGIPGGLSPRRAFPVLAIGLTRACSKCSSRERRWNIRSLCWRTEVVAVSLAMLLFTSSGRRPVHANESPCSRGPSGVPPLSVPWLWALRE